LATKTRSAILEEVYSRNKIEDNYFPPILSDQFFGPIGHHAFTGIHAAAQDLDLIPTGKRIGIVKPEMLRNNFVALYKNRINYVNYAEGTGWTELPNNWHLTERMQMIRGNQGFIECFDLVDRVFGVNTVSRDNPFYVCDNNYIEDSKKLLRSFGFGDSDWFVGLHIRNGSLTPELRNQSILNYIPAIKEITKMGGWVIRIGGREMPLLPKMERVIDLVAEENAAKHLHLFVLSACRFFIGTHSGPSWFPSLFGVPTIFTNHIAIGRCALIFSENSFTLPKSAIKRDGSYASLMEILNSPFGFGELTLREFAKEGLLIQENTPEELKNAILEMFSRISGQTLPREDQLNRNVSQVREQFPWTSKGLISHSYLITNERRFLN
jgi:putative glycosyltransferase (TIGR04372 family)